MIIEIDYESIFPIWEQFLWNNRQTKIETHSAMLYNSSNYDIKNFEYKATYLAFCVNDTIAGVNSGHMCSDGKYRSRGLFVFPQFRHQGIGTELLKATIVQGLSERATFIWSYPRETSWGTYHKAGFNLLGDWHDSELGRNAYCFFDSSSIKS